LWYSPNQAFIDLSSRAPYLVGALLAFVATFLYTIAFSSELWAMVDEEVGHDSPWLMFHLSQQLIAAAGPILFLSVVFVPACLLAASLIDRRASFWVLMRQEYAPLATTVLYSWAAAHLMMLVAAYLAIAFTGNFSVPAGGAGRQVLDLAIRIAPLPYFVFLAALAVKAVLRLSPGRAIGVIAVAALSLLVLPVVPGLLFFLSSPFLLIILIIVLRNFFGEMLGAQRDRENFKRNLETATLNPADASAHYNLGLIYQSHGQYEDAKNCFNRAVEIDPDEMDAHYQLGRIARQQGDLSGAISHFDSVVTRNSEHSQNEIWREIGRAYFDAKQYEDARTAFQRFLDRRESDAEGRYYYGLTLHNLGEAEDAAAQMQACIEAVRMAPTYKYRTEKRWMSEAQNFLRAQTKAGP
jgi:tetratricopeptide (TPR) repeat protein